MFYLQHNAGQRTIASKTPTMEIERSAIAAKFFYRREVFKKNKESGSIFTNHFTIVIVSENLRF